MTFNLLGFSVAVFAATDAVFCEVDEVAPAAKRTIPRRAATNTLFLCIAKVLLKAHDGSLRGTLMPFSPHEVAAFLSVGLPDDPNA